MRVAVIMMTIVEVMIMVAMTVVMMLPHRRKLFSPD
jgi:cell division protein FtsL